MKMLRQPTTHPEKKLGGIPSKEPRNLDPVILQPPTNTEGIELVRGDSKTVVDWISGHAKQRTTFDAMGAAQKQLRTGGAEASIYAEELMIGRTLFRQHNTDDAWAEKRVRGRQEEWEHDSQFVWPEVTGFCGIWDGSCRNDVCVAGMLINLLSRYSHLLWAGPQCTNSVGQRQVKIPKTLKSLAVQC